MSAKTPHSNSSAGHDHENPGEYQILKRLMWPLSATLLLLAAMVATLLWFQQEQQLQDAITQRISDTSARLQSAQVQQIAVMSALLEVITADPALQDALQAGDRDRLLALSRGPFEPMRQKIGISRFYFQDRDRNTVLRVYSPEKLGGHVDRFTTLEAGRTGRTAAGLELGSAANPMLRVVQPVHAGETLIGYVELAREIEDILQNLHTDPAVEIAVSLHKSVLDREVWEAAMASMGREADWDRFPNDVISYSTLTPLPDALIGAHLRDYDTSTHARLDLQAKANGRTWRVGFAPIRDASDKDIGDLTVMLDITAKNAAFKRTALAAAAVTVVVLAMLMFVLYVLLRRTDDHLRAQRASLLYAKAQQQAIFDTVTDGIVMIDEEGRIELVNPAAADIFDYPAGEMTGRNIGLLVPDLDHRQFDEAGVIGMNRSIEIQGRRRDGRIFPLEITANKTRIEERPLIVCVVRDITARKQAEAELEIAASVYQAIGEAIMIADAHNRIVAVNEQFTKLTGYGADEAVGRDTSLLKSGRQDSAFYKRMWQALETSGHWQGEIWNRRKNGEEYAEWLAIHNVYDESGEVLRRVALFSTITDKKQAAETIWRQANYDALTGLPNRQLFQDRLREEIRRTLRNGNSLALLFLDLDRFKEVNDSLGHEIGDLLLVEAARRISACVRQTDTVARLGGDEFTVIMPDIPNAHRIQDVAAEIVERLGAPFDLAGETVHVSASIGITLCPIDADEMTELLKRADQAMYVAKNEGRSRFSWFTQQMQTEAQARQALIRDLRPALAAGQFAVHFQPIVDLVTGRIRKAEALLRWCHPGRGMVNPETFIPLAEETGLIHEIGDWAFREAVRTAMRWMKAHVPGESPIQISVNKSPRQFFTGNTAESWIAYLDEIGLPAGCVVIEITEGLLLEKNPEVAEKLLQFRDSGVEIAIDDFGTGYSTLSYLKRFDIDYLKIDRSFIQDMEQDANNLAIAEAIIVMAHKLGLKVIAEGVETVGQRDLLVAAGCDYAQGFLFSKPVPADEFEKLLRDPPQIT